MANKHEIISNLTNNHRNANWNKLPPLNDWLGKNLVQKQEHGKIWGTIDNYNLTIIYNMTVTWYFKYLEKVDGLEQLGMHMSTSRHLFPRETLPHI